MTRLKTFLGTMAFLSVLFNGGCTKLNNELPAPTSSRLQVHPAGWNDTTSPDFHGKRLKSENYNVNDCITCHAKSFAGGISSVSCYKCHTTYPHTGGWNDSSAVNFHGKFLAARQWQLNNCTACHGTSLNGGTSGVSCLTCHTSYPHASGWSDSSAMNFHGKFLGARQWQLNNCTPCHGTSLNGGTSGVSCLTCHASYPHGNGWTDSTASAFHGNFIKASTWDMLQCRPCHGASYSGGRVNVSCLTCHVKPNGPENCTTCHGGINPAPPRDLNGNSDPSLRGVGAHQTHLLGSSVADSLECSECHNVPSSVYQPGHIDVSGRAQIHFNGPLGTLATAGGTFVPSPGYSSDSLRCGNTFCHGNWRLEESTSPYTFAYSDTTMSGSNYSPLWTGTSSEAACGSCHGLPPTGHISASLSRCISCHTGVVDANGTIIDNTKHMNGMVNVFGLEYRFGFPPPTFSTVKGSHK